MRIVFMGTPESAVPPLRRLLDDGHDIAAVWTQPDRPAGRGNRIHASPVKLFALENNLLIHQPAKIKTPEARKLFASHNADVVVVVAYGKILPKEYLTTSKYGSVNVHFSLLPKYRGAAPVNWAIVNGEKQTGVTTMKIVEELDAGPILLQRATPIGADETAPELMKRLAQIGAELISETLKNLDSIEAKPQLESEVSFAPMLARENGLIDWSMDAFAIERCIRGFQPWPNAYTSFDSRRLVIWKANPERTEQAASSAGSVLTVARDSFTINCGEATSLRIEELQLEASRRMTARDFVNGVRLKVGTILGKH